MNTEDSPAPDPWLSLREAATASGLSVRTLQRYHRAGRLAFERGPRGRPGVRRGVLAAAPIHQIGKALARHGIPYSLLRTHARRLAGPSGGGTGGGARLRRLVSESAAGPLAACMFKAAGWRARRRVLEVSEFRRRRNSGEDSARTAEATALMEVRQRLSLDALVVGAQRSQRERLLRLAARIRNRDNELLRSAYREAFVGLLLLHSSQDPKERAMASEVIRRNLPAIVQDLGGRSPTLAAGTAAAKPRSRTDEGAPNGT